MSRDSGKENIVFLSDIKKNGKERPWAEHKANSMLLADSYRRLGYYRKFERVCECGSSLKFNVCPSGHEKRLAWANFCRVRLCPMCGWRKSLLNAHQVKLVAHTANERQKLRWLFLTLTIKNVDGEHLEETIKYMSKSFHKFIRRKQFQDRVVGFFKSFEVTRNSKLKNYHPHFHVLLAVRPSYFGKDYMQKDEWAKLWQQSLKVDYLPTVDIRTVKEKKKDYKKELEILDSKGIEVTSDGTFKEKETVVPLGGALSEIAKYTVKSKDFIKKNNPKLTDEIVSVLDEALARKRLLSFGGLLKDIWQELRDAGQVEDSEDENANLIHVDDEKECKCSVCGSDMLEELYSWIPSQDNYILKTGQKNNPDGTGLRK